MSIDDLCKQLDVLTDQLWDHKRRKINPAIQVKMVVLQLRLHMLIADREF